MKILKWQNFLESSGEFKIKETPKVILNKMKIVKLIDEMESLDDPNFKTLFRQNNIYDVARDFIEFGYPSEWYLMKIINYLQSRGVDVPEEIWK
jgi:hypothetical protein